MSHGQYHDLCEKYRGRSVMIRTHDGNVHRGTIKHVNNHQVYIQPLGGPSRNFGGFSYGFGGYGGYGGGWGIALASIAAIALLPLFFF